MKHPLRPEFLVAMHEHGVALHAPPGAAGIPACALNEILPLLPKESVIDPGLGNALDAIMVLGAPAALDEWRKEVNAHLDATVTDPVTRWLKGTDTGASSEAIVFALTGRHQAGHEEPTGSTPADASDFGRCVRLLERFPDWRPQLGKVADRWPNGLWPRLVARWAELERAYQAAATPGGNFKAFTQLLRSL